MAGIVDVEFSNQGTVVLITPMTAAANEWFEANAADLHSYGGASYAVDPRCAADIIGGARGAGLICADVEDARRLNARRLRPSELTEAPADVPGYVADWLDELLELTRRAAPELSGALDWLEKARREAARLSAEQAATKRN